MSALRNITKILITASVMACLIVGVGLIPRSNNGIVSPVAYAAKKKTKHGVAPVKSTVEPRQCGGTSDAYTPVIDLGCKGKGNPIIDALLGIIHFLSLGVGLVVVGSVIVGGIQYSASRGDPQATAQAINRIRSALVALLIFIFAYAFLNYLLPNFLL